MNLLMLILIIVALWISGAIGYFAWTLTSELGAADKSDDSQESVESPDSGRPAE